MQTRFSEKQLADPAFQDSNRILRRCVHCGFCNATCPTYQLLGDELDGPRGRIYLMKDMLENEAKPTSHVVKHIDRCLSCLACMTTCPSGVHYMHLVDHARAYIEQNFRRPLAERLLRRLLALTLPFPARFRLMLALVGVVKPLASCLPGRLGRMAAESPSLPERRGRLDGWYPAGRKPRRGVVGLLAGCVQQVLGGEINAATVRILTRLGFDVRVMTEQPCCGALEHHLGMGKTTRARLERNVSNWQQLMEAHGIDTLVVNTSGCGTMLKDYAYLLRHDARHADAARLISAKTKDVSEFLGECGSLPVTAATPLTVAYQSACSLQHGQGINAQPVALLQAVGFEVRRLPEEHICCGSAGTYNLLQTEIAEQLGRRKAESIRGLDADVVATGNLGCMTQIGRYIDLPIVHTVQLIDWASGGPRPSALAGRTTKNRGGSSSGPGMTKGR